VAPPHALLASGLTITFDPLHVSFSTLSYRHTVTSKIPYPSHPQEKIALMTSLSRAQRLVALFLACVCLITRALPSAQAQDQPPSFSPDQLDQIVSRIALYPDPLLAQILTASTFSDQIPDAASWADQHHYLTGQALSNAITADQLPWDPSVQALLPFPSVLDQMASDPNWTNDLGNAVLAQRPEVMDAVQRMRQKAKDFGYLRSNGQIVVSGAPGYIEIEPANPAFVVVPAYDPRVVYFAPRPGFVVGSAIGLGFGVTIGTYFRPWGWGYSHLGWRDHVVIVNNRPWNRTWVNRREYVHPYPAVHRYGPVPGRAAAAPPRVVEHHELVPRSAHERELARGGQPHVEEHHPQPHRDDHRR
jgi:hypothetical protein